MKDASILGCGRFDEGTWSELIAAAGPAMKHFQGHGTPERSDAPHRNDVAPPDAGHRIDAADAGRRPNAGEGDDAALSSAVTALHRHITECDPCRAEWDAFAALAGAVQSAVEDRRPSRDAFIDSVLATARAQEAAKARQTGAPHPATRWQQRKRRVSADPARQTKRRRLRWMPRPVAAAAMLALLALLGAGVLTMPWQTDEPAPTPRAVDVAEQSVQPTPRSVDVAEQGVQPTPRSVDVAEQGVQPGVRSVQPESRTVQPIVADGRTTAPDGRALAEPPTASGVDDAGEPAGTRASGTTSVAQVLPGGAILRAVQSVAKATTARAGALRNDGVSDAATGGEPTTSGVASDGSSAGGFAEDLEIAVAQTIRITAGALAAASAP